MFCCSLERNFLSWKQQAKHISKHWASGNTFKNHTKQVVFGQGIQDPGGSYQVTHGSRHGRGVNPNCHQGRPQIDVSQETVVFLKKVTEDNG